MSKYLWFLLSLIWLGASAGGLAWLWSYSLTPGEIRLTGRDWPEGSRLAPEPGKFSLLMFVHPECPCSQASLEDLGQLLARSGGRLDARVVFLQPEEMKEAWADTSLWRQAREIPGVKVVGDADGREAGLFSAATSGDTFVYDKAGRLVFHGGLTAGRGHCGDNDGSTLILDLLEGRDAGMASPAGTPVYGCSLSGASTASGMEGAPRE